MGHILPAGISVPLLKVQFACPAFRGNLFLFCLHSDDTAIFIFLLFCLLFSFSVVKSIFCGSFSAAGLISSNEELLLSEVS